MQLAARKDKQIATTFRAILVLLSGTVLSSGVAMLTNFMLARQLGSEQFGVFSAALICVTIVAPLAGLGVDSFLLRVFGREGWNGIRWIRFVFQFVAYSSFAAFGGLIIYSILSDQSGAQLILILTPILFSQVLLTLASSKLQLEERYSLYAFLQSSTNVLRCIAVLGTSAIIAITPFIAATAYAGVAIVVIACALPLVRDLRIGVVALKGHGLQSNCAQSNQLPSVTHVAKESWKFGMSGFLYLLYYQSPVVILSIIVDPGAAGQFNAATLILNACFIFPSVVFQKYLMPKLHRWASNNSPALKTIYFRGSFFMLIAGVFMAIVVWLSSTYLIFLLFGPSFEGAVQLLALLSVCIPIRFFSATADAVLTSGRELNAKLRVLGLSALLGVAMNLTLTPIWGFYAAALSTIICEIVIAIFLHASAHRVLQMTSK